MNKPIASTLLLLSLLSSPTRAADIYVSPQGSDTSPGTASQPLATLTAARAAARLVLQQHQPATVFLQSGDYFLTDPFDLSAEDSGSPASPTIYRSCENQPVRLIGARKFTASDFKPITDSQTLQRIDEPLRNKILQLDLQALHIRHTQPFPDVFADAGGLIDLFVAGQRQPLSRFPNQTCMNMQRVLDTGGGPQSSNWRQPVQAKPSPNSTGAFQYRDAFAAEHQRWASALDHGVWLKGYWRVMWENRAIRVKSIDTDAHTVTFAKPIPGGIGSKYHRPEGDGKEKYWLMNLLEAIDFPGEWCVDFKDQKLYFYPPASLQNAEILLADNDAPILRLTNASHVLLRGLTVEAGLADGIRIQGGHDNLVAGCTVRNVDKYAVVLDGGTSHAVQSCDLYELGAGGVWLGGGDENSSPRIPANHRVVNNHIHHFARIERVYAPAVNCGFTGGGNGGHHPAVGMLVAHNLIHDTPHVGVLFGSWDSTFEYNEVFRFCTFSNDMGAFYAYDQFGRFGHHTFRYNLMHSSDDGDAIYFDLDHPDMTLFGNIAFLQSKGKRGTGFLYKMGTQSKNPQSIDCRNNIAFQCNWGFEFVSVLPNSGKIENNIAVMCKNPWTWREVKGQKEIPVKDGYPSGKNLTCVSNPGFANPAKLDFHLKPDAQILKDLPGFKAIPVDKIGLYVDEYRRTLPTDNDVDRFSQHTPKGIIGYDVEDRK